jgi:hypothetical protein
MNFHLRRRTFWCAVCVIFILGAPCSYAEDYLIPDRLQTTLSLPGAFAITYSPNSSDPTTGPIHYGDPYGYGFPYSAFAVVLDTGTSGNVLSAFDAESLGIPILPGEHYVDVGIGGNETFNVSGPTGIRIGPTTLYDEFAEVDNTEDPNSYPTSHGVYNFQVRQSDPVDALNMPVPINIIGTPVLNQYVMHVKPNGHSFFPISPPIDYVETYLHDSMPTDLPSTGVFHVPLTYQNFVANSGSVSTSTNPLVQNVQAVLNDQTSKSNWLLDTGAQLTIIGTTMAGELGITPGINYDDIMTVGGIGPDQVVFYGYKIDKLVVPMTGGQDNLVFPNIMVYVTDGIDLPAGLQGVLGMNLLGQSFSTVDPIWGIPDDLIEGAFSDFYINPGIGGSPELVLVLNAVPEPSTLVLLAVGLGSFFLWRFQLRRRSA